jgi:thiosulfate/3-mercaptopyruvate sulfurtransferase
MKKEHAWKICRDLLIGLSVGLIIQSPALAAELEGCAKCHLDSSRIDELTEDLIVERQVVESSELQRGEGYAVKKAPFDLYENVLVKEAFLNTAHGKIACSKCHQGDPRAETPEAAHQGMIKDPSLAGAQENCGPCHPEITRTASHSSHAAMESSLSSLRARCTPEQWQALNNTGAIGQQCATCHASSCGSCHVSRPRVNGGGLVAGHLFQRRPDYVTQCAACHDKPIVDDFTGQLSRGDVHYLAGKVCVDCHGAQEAHAAAPTAGNRFTQADRVRCTNCHGELATSKSCTNALHQEKVDCTVCHSQPYDNCTSCHMGVDDEELVYSQSNRPRKGFKIGLNPAVGKGEPRFVLVREVPVQADSFNPYLPQPLKELRPGATFKRSAVHNIQRQTWQNAHCNHCHGQASLFLTTADLPLAARAANQKVVVPAAAIPKAVSGTAPLTIPGPKRNESLRVDASWLHNNIQDPNLFILDVRLQKQYEEGHIPGARNLCECYLTTGFKSNPPYMMNEPATLAKLVAEKVGLTPEKRVVIYDDGKNKTGVAFVALARLGHQQVAFLDGNINAWNRAGYALEKGPTPVVAANSAYPAKANDEVLVNSQQIKENFAKGGMVLLDARNASEYMGHSSRTDVAKKAGHIPGAQSLPLKALMDDEGALKGADELNWIFSQYGITPTMDKTIITSCNTKSLASELYMALRYLGYEKVKVHDGSWAEWSRLY